MTAKSDYYSISINSLLLAANPKSIAKVENLLDDNGYYGRYRIVRESVPVFAICIKIEVYLPESLNTYKWPFKTYYNLSTNSFGKRRIPRVIKNTFRFNKIMLFLALCDLDLSSGVDRLALSGSKIMGWANKDDYVKTIMFFIKCGMFVNSKFCIKTEQDVVEVQSNLFDPNYFSTDF